MVSTRLEDWIKEILKNIVDKNRPFRKKVHEYRKVVYPEN